MDIEVTHSLVELVSVIPLLILFVVSIVPITTKVFSNNRESDGLFNTVIGVFGFLACMFATISLGGKIDEPLYLFSKAILLDQVSVFSTVLVCIASIVIVLLSYDSGSIRGRQYSEYLFLLLNAVLGMIVVAWSNDLIVTFIGIEVMSLCLYLLIAMSQEEYLSKEAALKYFVLGSLASAVFLYGIALIFGAGGTTYIDEIIAIAPEKMLESSIFTFGVLLAVIGLCFKVSIAPFHAWTPDVYEGAPTPITAFMATGVKLVTFVAFMRLLVGDYISAGFGGSFVGVLQWLAVLTMVVGNIGALLQENLKRMLAYSSVAHSGYIMMGLIAGAVGGEAWLGATGVTYYVFAYTIMTLGAFGIVSILEKTDSDVVLIGDLSGLGKQKPYVAIALAIFLLSLAGIPPLVGFFGKFFLFSAAIKQGFFWMVVWAGLNSIISVYYYLRPVVQMYMKESEIINLPLTGYLSVGAVYMLALLTVVAGIFTDPVYDTVISAVRGLF